MTTSLIRSKLFVPASRPELFDKALASDADAISFDLEDAVVAERKEEARANLSDLLDRLAQDGTEKIIIVRTNDLSTPHVEQDLACAARSAVDMITLPKVETAEDAGRFSAMLRKAAEANGIGKAPVIAATIELPGALRCAAEIAMADDLVVGLQLGLADMLEPLAIERREETAIRQIQLSLRLAAGEAGVWAMDAAYTDVSDMDGFRREAEAAKRLGYMGKSCIHPKQVGTANEVFRPSGDEIDFAFRVIEAASNATRAGTGAFMVDGRMIDGPFVRRAEATLETARKLGLVDGS